MIEVVIVAIASDLATAVGVLPAFFLQTVHGRFQGIATACAGGMMLSASLFALADEALNRGSGLVVSAGMIAGALFFAAAARFVARGNGRWATGARPITPAAAGGARCSCTARRRASRSASAMRPAKRGSACCSPPRLPFTTFRKARRWRFRCAWYAVLTSLPQPLLAVPAFLLTTVFQPLVAPSLGFAGGATIFLVVAKLLPESFEAAVRMEVAWAFTLGLVGMLGFTAALGL